MKSSGYKESMLPSQQQLKAEWVPRLCHEGKVYEKFLEMHARHLESEGTLDTLIDGELETTNKYQVGDMMIHGTQGERYVMKPDNFAARYWADQPRPTDDPSLAAEGFQLFRPRGKIWALQLSREDVYQHFPEGKFIAPWGSEMLFAANDFLATPYPDCNEIYRIEEKAFHAMYRLADVPSESPPRI
ncbi:hypothetical protein AB1Y20_009463 [Prymnesium parvum]|uniref:Uncharacterized protein n=1 Tax=Prymnesium parvum TaxID=97485 RepID=A0AB34K4D4_PRYPA